MKLKKKDRKILIIFGVLLVVLLFYVNLRPQSIFDGAPNIGTPYNPTYNIPINVPQGFLVDNLNLSYQTETGAFGWIELYVYDSSLNTFTKIDCGNVLYKDLDADCVDGKNICRNDKNNCNQARWVNLDSYFVKNGFITIQVKQNPEEGISEVSLARLNVTFKQDPSLQEVCIKDGGFKKCSNIPFYYYLIGLGLLSIVLYIFLRRKYGKRR